MKEALAWFFLSCPTAEHIKTYLDTILLLSTLMLGFAISFLVSFDPEVLAAADLRWLGWCTNSTIRSLPQMDRWCEGIDASQPMSNVLYYGWHSRPSHVLGERAIWTYGLLAMSLALAVVQYLFMLGFQVDRVSEYERRSWWIMFQWPCHLAMGLFVLGTVCFVYTNVIVVRVIFVSDVDLLLGGADGGLWMLVQIVSWLTMGLMATVILLNFSLYFAWRHVDRRRHDVAGAACVGRTVELQAAAAAAPSAEAASSI